MLKKEHVSISRHRVSGETINNVHFSMYGFLIHSHIPIVLSTWQHATEKISKKKEEPMINESERWNMDVFHHLSFPCLAAWAQLQRWCTRSSLP